MIVSQKRIEANRLNAQKSTGPRTEEGKARSSANAVRHGLCAQVLVVEREKEPYEQFVAALRQELCPATPLQEFLFQRLAGRLEGWWMQREEEQILERRRPQPQPVRRGRKPQKQPPEPTDPTPVEPEQAMSWMVSDKPKRLQLLWRYEGQLERSFQKTLKQLMEMKESQGEVQEREELPAEEANAAGPVDNLTRAEAIASACPLAEGDGEEGVGPAVPDGSLERPAEPDLLVRNEVTHEGEGDDARAVSPSPCEGEQLRDEAIAAVRAPRVRAASPSPRPSPREGEGVLRNEAISETGPCRLHPS